MSVYIEQILLAVTALAGSVLGAAISHLPGKRGSALLQGVLRGAASVSAVWWACLVLALCRGLTFGTLASSAGLSLLAAPLGQLLNVVRDTLSAWIGRIGL